MAYGDRVRRALTIAALALLGLALAVGLTVATSSLTNQAVGLSDEPLTAGEQLAVPTPTPRAAEQPPQRTPTPTPSPSPAPTVDDDRGGDSSGSGSDDDSGSGSDDRGGDNSGPGSENSGRDDGESDDD